MRVKRNRKVIVAASASVLLVGGVAFAYWTTSGTGTGTAGTGDTIALVVHQNGPITGLTPGGTPLALSGTFDNPNTSAVHIGGLTATIASVSPTTCLASNFAISGTATVPGDIGAGPGTGQGTWSGLKIALTDTGVNQDVCKKAQVTLSYKVANAEEHQYTRTVTALIPGKAAVAEIITTCTATTATVGTQVYQYQYASQVGWGWGEPYYWTTEQYGSGRQNNGVSVTGCDGTGARIQTPAIPATPDTPAVTETSGWLSSPPAGTGWAVSATRVA
jgi:hypothetical protein